MSIGHVQNLENLLIRPLCEKSYLYRRFNHENSAFINYFQKFLFSLPFFIFSNFILFVMNAVAKIILKREENERANKIFHQIFLLYLIKNMRPQNLRTRSELFIKHDSTVLWKENSNFQTVAMSFARKIRN